MNEPIPYADYVRIEVRVDGKTRVIEFAPPEWDKGDRPMIRVEPADAKTDEVIFSSSPVRAVHAHGVALRFEVSGPEAKVSDEEAP